MDNGDGMETITVSPGMHQMMIQGEPQVLQVLSLKDAQMLSKAMGVEVKDDGEEKMYTIKWNPEFTALHFGEWTRRHEEATRVENDDKFIWRMVPCTSIGNVDFLQDHSHISVYH